MRLFLVAILIYLPEMHSRAHASPTKAQDIHQAASETKQSEASRVFSSSGIEGTVGQTSVRLRTGIRNTQL